MQVNATSAESISEFSFLSANPDILEGAALRQTSFAGIVSEAPAMKRVFNLVQRVAKSGSTALLLGESGTGKELIARAIHKLSGRIGKLVPVNCAAIPEEILESELFGHEKGSFTGAVSSRIGRFQMADGGTIFLDEIGEMSPKLQVKLLRVLQEKIVEPVGSTRSVNVDVRVVAATNKDLRKEVREGRFREDLYYRLQVVPIEIPPLRDRGSDIVLLANYFIEKTCTSFKQPPIRLGQGVKECFLNYAWPGNVRELENLIERLAVLCDGEEISINDLPDYMIESKNVLPSLDAPQDIPPEGIDFNQLVNDFEVRLITMAMSKTNGNKKAAAQLLRLNRTTLVEKIKKKSLDDKLNCNLDCIEDEGRFCQ
ncbi:MAG: sigma-54-dependent Fis family transcriptional regulator [SAR324 cluster bacterium]|uniref:Sigma-54-dependent Fis family transcriptional regulator n=1 Tax=SAR324 cluster bacterium TaxID=2024889 RepID=A0A7X9FV72_9DELT|nr:sigma-54-dependent Fis family transcriptional regulator [SAR324 cluster bacterium]